jgi:hypothetical protein
MKFGARPWVALSLVATVCLGAAERLPEPDPARLREDLEFLCSEALNGRETGTDGATKAAAHLAARMQAYGLEPLAPGGFGEATPFHFPWTYRGARFFVHPTVRRTSKPMGGDAWNVVGAVPGSDPALRSQWVFVTAHYDHLGGGGGTVYPGADDNASGTAALLEAMRLLRHAGPRRSIAFLAVSGEEEGLLGSEAFLASSPMPLDAIKADINLDMVGRGRPGELHIMPARRPGYVTTLTREARARAAAHGVKLSAGLEDYWRRSDHYSFARRGIPALCFNSGLHRDYHQPSDTPDKINYGSLARVVAIVRDLALATANADRPPQVLPRDAWEDWAWGPYETPNSYLMGSGPLKKQEAGRPSENLEVVL